MIGLILAGIFELYILFNIEKPKRIVLGQLYLSMFILLFTSTFNAPAFVAYFCDFNNILLLIHLIAYFFSKDKTISIKQYRFSLVCILVFLVVGITIAIGRSVAFYLILWSIRNYGRFLVFLFAVFVFWDEKLTKKVFDSFIYLLVVNAIFSVYQNMTGVIMDNTGGIFGTEYGANAYSLLFFAITVPYYIDSYLKHKTGFFVFVLAFICMIICAIVAELKFFYFMAVGEIVFVMIMNKLSLRMVLIVFLGIIAGTVVYFASLTYFNGRNVFDLAYIIDYLTEGGYSYTSESINRFNGITKINEQLNFLTFDKIFGLGLGSGEYCSFFTSPVYDQIKNSHYYFFSFSWLYLETGLVGTILYYLTFISLLFELVLYKKPRLNKNTIETVSLSLLFCCLVFIIYNSSLRNDCSYYLYAIIAIGLRPNQSEAFIDG